MSKGRVLKARISTSPVNRAKVYRVVVDTSEPAALPVFARVHGVSVTAAPVDPIITYGQRSGGSWVQRTVRTRIGASWA